MPKNTTVQVASDWVELTDSDVENLTFQNQGPANLLIAGSVNGDPPSSGSGALLYRVGQGERLVLLSELFPGMSAVRVFAKASWAKSMVMVSHA